MSGLTRVSSQKGVRDRAPMGPGVFDAGGESAVQVSDTAPAGAAGSVWLDSSTGRVYVYFDSHWIEIGAAGTSDALSTLISKTADYTIAVTDQIIAASAASGKVTLTLPAASVASGKQYIIKKTDSSANSVVVDANGSETIDGQLTQSLTAQYEALTIVSNGSQWLIV